MPVRSFRENVLLPNGDIVSPDLWDQAVALGIAEPVAVAGARGDASPPWSSYIECSGGDLSFLLAGGHDVLLISLSGSSGVDDVARGALTWTVQGGGWVFSCLTLLSGMTSPRDVLVLSALDGCLSRGGGNLETYSFFFQPIMVMAWCTPVVGGFLMRQVALVVSSIRLDILSWFAVT
ncbi:hypothetical protein BXZ70DRAFT_904344 [Cristinia sonorae]|uniref:Uncharacterized protein n=1 Tax=Cristinia sonorae TaxID=1940300 RepID=A0A8K0UUU8_9AGAR|nr:hypothetical protein BXZ70DRAFT_904344 [Cristinia sonorae]